MVLHILVVYMLFLPSYPQFLKLAEIVTLSRSCMLHMYYVVRTMLQLFMLVCTHCTDWVEEILVKIFITAGRSVCGRTVISESKSCVVCRVERSSFRSCSVSCKLIFLREFLSYSRQHCVEHQSVLLASTWFPCGARWSLNSRYCPSGTRWRINWGC